MAYYKMTLTFPHTHESCVMRLVTAKAVLGYTQQALKSAGQEFMANPFWKSQKVPVPSSIVVEPE